MEHVAIIAARYAPLLQRRTKTVETRFSRTRRAPFGRISVNDIVHFRISGGEYCGSWRVRAAESVEITSTETLWALERRVGHLVGANASYWKSRLASRYGTLIWLGRRTRLQPPHLTRQFGSAWIVLPEGARAGEHAEECVGDDST